jgi:hypothetical protein
MTTLMTERNLMGMPGMGMTGASATTPAAPNMMMVPRCKMTFEKCTGGMKMTCVCEDQTSAGMLQNLCTMMAGGMCSCCMMMNGMMVCCCNMMMGMCKCEPINMGVCFTCTSGDKECCAMIQACCDCCANMMKAGCTCCMMMNGMPVCCSC